MSTQNTLELMDKKILTTLKNVYFVPVYFVGHVFAQLLFQKAFEDQAAGSLPGLMNGGEMGPQGGPPGPMGPQGQGGPPPMGQGRGRGGPPRGGMGGPGGAGLLSTPGGAGGPESMRGGHMGMGGPPPGGRGAPPPGR